MPVQESVRRVAELEANMLISSAEEALILKAAADGIEVLRRVDPHTMAVLGVAIAMEAQQLLAAE
jgi:hypothetical protein